MGNAGRMDTQVSKMIKEAVENCSVCQKAGRSRSKPSVAIPRATDFNSIVTLDLKEMGKKNILWMVDAFSRTLAGAIIKDKKAETILEKLEMRRCGSDGIRSSRKKKILLEDLWDVQVMG